jgi:hypothetical protein
VLCAADGPSPATHQQVQWQAQLSEQLKFCLFLSMANGIWSLNQIGKNNPPITNLTTKTLKDEMVCLHFFHSCQAHFHYIYLCHLEHSAVKS